MSWMLIGKRSLAAIVCVTLGLRVLRTIANRSMASAGSMQPFACGERERTHMSN